LNRAAILSNSCSIQWGSRSNTETPASTKCRWFGSARLPDSSAYKRCISTSKRKRGCASSPSKSWPGGLENPARRKEDQHIPTPLTIRRIKRGVKTSILHSFAQAAGYRYNQLVQLLSEAAMTAMAKKGSDSGEPKFPYTTQPRALRRLLAKFPSGPSPPK
jgi:hypothetical protein